VAADQAPSDLSNAALAAVLTVPVSSHFISNVDDLYQQAISATNNQVSDALGGDLSIGLTQLIQIGQPDYDTEPDGTLRPRAAPPAADTLPDQQDGTWIEPAPWLAHDAGFRSARPVNLQPNTPAAEFAAVRIGVFDPASLAASGPLTSAPLDAYAPTSATGADTATRTLLHNQPMLPSDNIGGYLATAPSILVSLNTLHDLAPDRGDPISAVRVRVAGVYGFDAVSREHVRLVAENIARTTGLDVDIVFGSSPAPQTVALDAGTYGRPALRLAEPWSKLNVATRLIQAVDRKSAGLFALILIVCVLFLGNAVAAAVRDRHRELAILACMGWPRRRLFGVVLGEVTLVGLAAGALSSLLAIPLGHAAGTTVPIWQSLLAVPVALALALSAGMQPAVRASRAHPASALAPAVLRTRRPARRRLVASMALANLWRTPGRTLLGGFALAVGVCALTLLAIVQWTFHGAAVGTVLGDAVALQVRSVDLVAVATTVLLGVFAVADVLYLNLRERAAELAVLQATGWSSGALLRLIGYEGAGLGLLGALAGAGSAIGLALPLFGEDNRVDAVIAVAGLTAGIGVLLTVLAAAVPAVLLRRLPTASLLAEE
jgi:hypothetical protein